MRAVIIATGITKNSETEFEAFPRELIQLIDRPFIQHVVENLVEQGIIEFDFILSHQPERFEKMLGDGKRWGSKFNFHLIRNAANPYKSIKSTAQNDESILLVHADRLMTAKIEDLNNTQATKPQIYYWSEDNSQEKLWSGYAILNKQILSEIDFYKNETDLTKFLLQTDRWEKSLIEVEKPLNVLSYEELLKSQNLIFQKKTFLTGFSANEVENGVWISRNVMIHPTAIIKSPVFIGENCRIGAESEIGPNAVVGSNCLIDKKCQIQNSVITAGSFLGENLTVSDSIVLKHRLVNTRMEVQLTILDKNILGNLFDRDLNRWVNGIFSQLLGIFLLILTSPILFLTILHLKLKGERRVFKNIDVVQLPSKIYEYKYKTFKLLNFMTSGNTDNSFEWGTGGIGELILRFLPALINVARGEIRLVGVRPRTVADIKNLPEDWQVLYLSSKAGLITEAFVQYGANPSFEELYASECIYAVRAGIYYDFKLIFGFFKRLVQNLISRPQTNGLKTISDK